jgi:hypothetical protein
LFTVQRRTFSTYIPFSEEKHIIGKRIIRCSSDGSLTKGGNPKHKRIIYSKLNNSKRVFACFSFTGQKSFPILMIIFHIIDSFLLPFFDISISYLRSKLFYDCVITMATVTKKRSGRQFVSIGHTTGEGLIRLMSEVSAQKAAAQDTQESVASKRRVPKNPIIFVLKTTPLSTLQYRYIF